MNRTIPFAFLRQFLAWLLFFQLTRLIFVAWNWALIKDLPYSELLALPYHAVYLDTAMSCYFMGVPFLLFAGAILTKKHIFLRINTWFTALLVAVTGIITIADLPIYDEWQSKLSYKAISMLDTPSEVVRTATNAQLFGGTLAIILLSGFGIWLFNKITGKPNLQQRLPLYMTIPFLLISPFLIGVGLRGGLQQIPIQVSDAYYSEHNIFNTASTNSVFHLMSSCLQNTKAGKPYRFLPKAEADSIFASLHNPNADSTTHIFNIEKPNIVLVILESWSADLLSICGGYAGIAPNMEALAQNGVLFKNTYASGLRSDQGMAAILSGFPAQPRTSIIKQPNKFEHLPCINKDFEKLGYFTSFLFGGQLSYGNIRSFLMYNGFDRIVEGKDFDEKLPRGKLGVADEYLFQRQLEELEKERQPFFAAMFTMSTHSPYDAPMQPVLDWGGKENAYLNSAVYADRCIADFMEKAKQMPWYKNTVFVFVADHSHPSPKNWQYNQPESRRIPLLLYGEPIQQQYRGMVDSLPASQTDIAATLLAQLNIPTNAYPYSKNLFNPNVQRSAFYSIDEGFCMMKQGGQVCWHVDTGGWTEYEVPNPTQASQRLVKEGQSILKRLMDDYFSF
jgi:phosphoglycerol transferase MdoB-like AlkP superfamily enzyme